MQPSLLLVLLCLQLVFARPSEDYGRHLTARQVPAHPCLEPFLKSAEAMHVALQEPEASKVGALCKHPAGQVRVVIVSCPAIEARSAVLKVDLPCCRWHVTDDQGWLCPRSAVDWQTGCCTKGEQYTCQG